jgi:hypothetical protein
LELQVAERPSVTRSGDWRIIHEALEGPDDFSSHIVQHIIDGNSCCVEGCAGTGKTEVLKSIEAALKENGIACRKICLTHCGTRNFGEGGMTSHSFVNKHVLHGTFSGKVVLIDEISFMSLDLLAALEHLRLKGVRLVCFGDFLQFTPVSNRWRGVSVSPEAFQSSDLYKAWAGCTKFVLNRARRNDTAHFDFCNRIRRVSIDEGVNLAMERYPPRNELATWNLVVSHWRRRLINNDMQKRAAAKVQEKAWIEDAEVPFHIFAGTELMGRNNDFSHIKTGAFLVVTKLLGDGVEMQDEGLKETFKLNFGQVAKYTRLRHAMTLYSTQGRSLQGTIAVHDWLNKYFTSTSLYVALSRARESDKVWMAASRKCL